MPRRTKASDGVSDVLDPATIQRIAAAIAPVEPARSDLDSMLARVKARVENGPPAGTFTIRAEHMRWVAVGPGVEVMVLRTDLERNDQTVLIRMQPGSVVVGHRHTQEEECFVLEGEVFVGDHRLGAGDMHVARPGAVHAPIRAAHAALLLIRSEMPPQNFRIA